MSRNKSFSERGGYQTSTAEITVRNDAPDEFRGWLMGHLFGIPDASLQWITNVVRRKALLSDTSNVNRSWIDSDMLEGLHALDWFEVYDLIEEVADILSGSDKKYFVEGINKYFYKRGIGYEIIEDEEGRLIVGYRGSDEFEKEVKEAMTSAFAEGVDIATKHLIEARIDLGRKPEPDLKGAVTHAMQYLETIANSRNVTRKPLGNWASTELKPKLDAGRKPLADMIGTFYGYANDFRHGNLIMPTIEEAEYCIRQAVLFGQKIQYYWKLPNQTVNGPDDDLPF